MDLPLYAPPASSRISSVDAPQLSGTVPAALRRLLRHAGPATWTVLATFGGVGLLSRAALVVAETNGDVHLQIDPFIRLAGLALATPALATLLLSDEAPPPLGERLRAGLPRALATSGAYSAVFFICLISSVSTLTLGALPAMVLTSLVVPLVALGVPLREAIPSSARLVLLRPGALGLAWLGGALLALGVRALGVASEVVLSGYNLTQDGVTQWVEPLLGLPRPFGLLACDLASGFASLIMLAVALELLCRLEGQRVLGRPFSVPGRPEQVDDAPGRRAA